MFEILKLAMALLLAGYGNWYAGRDKPYNKEIFGAFMTIACLILGFSQGVSLLVGLGAYAGRQWISHGIVYRQEALARQGGPWWAVSFARVSIFAAPIAAPYPVTTVLATLAAFGCVCVNRMTERLQSTGKIKDMLLWAEPLQGVLYGCVLYSLSRL